MGASAIQIAEEIAAEERRGQTLTGRRQRIEDFEAALLASWRRRTLPCAARRAPPTKTPRSRLTCRPLSAEMTAASQSSALASFEPGAARLFFQRFLKRVVVGDLGQWGLAATGGGSRASLPRRRPAIKGRIAVRRLAIVRWPAVYRGEARRI